MFDGLEHLWSLNLGGNKLRALPEGLFRNLSSLSDLYLQGNRLRTLPEDLFRNLNGLRRLNLQNNGLEELPSSACAETMLISFCLFERMTSLPLLFNWPRCVCVWAMTKNEKSPVSC